MIRHQLELRLFKKPTNRTRKRYLKIRYTLLKTPLKRMAISNSMREVRKRMMTISSQEIFFLTHSPAR